MRYTSATTLRDDAAAVSATVSAAVDAIADLLRTTTWTDQDVGALVSALTGAASTILAIRSDLDETRMADLQRYEDGATLLALVGWERDIRRALGLLAGQVQGSLAVALELQAGVARGYYTTRPGDTLEGVAALYLGGWQEWPRLAAANGLQPGPVAAGTTLIIPQAV